MGQEGSSTSKDASGRGSRAATPTNADIANGTMSTKKRPRSETPVEPSTNNNNNDALDTPATDTGPTAGEESSKKKKKTNDDTNNNEPSYQERIARASSPATMGLLESSLRYLTEGIPRRELKLIVSEAKACETALEDELDVLRKALASKDDMAPKETSALESMLASEFTPPDTSWTLSALLGRLRHELTTPLPPRSQLPEHREKQGLTQLAHNVSQSSVKTTWAVKPQAQTTNAEETADSTTNTAANAAGIELSQFARLGFLPDHPEYTRVHESNDKLLAVWKKLSTHRSSLVFRRPVNPKEAPGYTDRIRFPMDLSLIRKLILSKHVSTYEGLLRQVQLIGHNCVKYNGRESDYALVTREFESVAIEYVWTAVTKERKGGSSRASSPLPPPASTTTPSEAPSATITTAVLTKEVSDITGS